MNDNAGPRAGVGWFVLAGRGSAPRVHAIAGRIVMMQMVAVGVIGWRAGHWC